jgi:hypothetical protein
MNNCCTQKEVPGHYLKSHNCPVNGKTYQSVKRKTLLHHVSQPWASSLTQQEYYFCSDPLCDVVYFGRDNRVIHTDELRTTVWQKSHDADATICYCFGVTKLHALQDKSIKSFITEQTKKSLCSCETSNPSGRCCLKDFPQS